MIPLKNIILLPNIIAPLFVGREKSVKTILHAVKNEKNICLFTQKSNSVDNPKQDDIYEYGVEAKVLQLMHLPDGSIKVLVEAVKRLKMTRFIETDMYQIEGEECVMERVVDTGSIESIRNLLSEKIKEDLQYNKEGMTQDIYNNIKNIEDHVRFAYVAAHHSSFENHEIHDLLQINKPEDLLRKIYEMVSSIQYIEELEDKINQEVRQKLSKHQKEYYLNEKIRQINKELGKDEDTEINKYEERIKASAMPDEVKKVARSELKRLEQMPSVSSETGIIHDYLDLLLDLPWGKNQKLSEDFSKSAEILDEDHYGLEKVKERILEYIAVQQRAKKVRGSVLCLIGPPGVGKTSIAKSIAKSMGRKYARIALGGLRDEAEIRGHRRTYIGAMPGRVIQTIKKSGVSNPMILLDEIDKIGVGRNGNLSSALLEVLDPEQNHSFSDHYLEVDYDISNVMFVCTSNSYDIPSPLYDRLEIIDLSGYTEEEKLEITKGHLIKKELENNMVKPEEWGITDDAIVEIIRHYTREAGVRNLSRNISRLIRKALKEILETNGAKQIMVTEDNVAKYLGERKYLYTPLEGESAVGMVNGLAYNGVGGSLLTIEANLYHGKGKLKYTGKLGDVMQESIQAAETFLKSYATEYGINPKEFYKKDIHLHVPEGATPKDGPSAGMAMFITLLSAWTNIPVRKDVAMTGEITLRGKILPIGGLKEKFMGAIRMGIKTVLIPKENEKDLEDIPETIKSKLTIIPVKEAKEAIPHCLVSQPQQIVLSDEEIEREIKNHFLSMQAKDPVDSSNSRLLS